MSEYSHTELQQDVQLRQRNTLWPDTVRNAAKVDGFILKGSPRATKLQRAGILIFGLAFLSVAAIFLLLVFTRGFERASIVLCAISLASAYLGHRLVRNAFLR